MTQTLLIRLSTNHHFSLHRLHLCDISRFEDISRVILRGKSSDQKQMTEEQRICALCSPSVRFRFIPRDNVAGAIDEISDILSR